LGDFAWLSDWTSTGHNETGPILDFVRNAPGDVMGRADYGTAAALAQSTGKAVPFGGGQAANTSSAATLFVVLPSGGSQVLFLDVPVKALSFAPVNPGDDVMRAAIHRWVGDAPPAVAPVVPYSQAVSVVTGQTPAQAAQIAAMNQQSSAALGIPSTSFDYVESQSTNHPVYTGEADAPGAVTGLSGISIWVWLAGAAVAVWFVMGRE
jgi:hypothetical protein